MQTEHMLQNESPHSETLTLGMCESASGVVVAYIEVDSMYRFPLKDGELVRLVRDSRTNEFQIVHGVHGKLYALYSRANVLLAQLIDQGHLELLLDTVVVDASNVSVGVYFWIEIRIARDSVEMVSTRLFREARLRVFLSIRLGGFSEVDDVLGQVFRKWKTSQQFCVESAAPCSGLCPPADVIKLELYEHQKQGLRWMICREEELPADDDELPPFWEEKDGVYRAELSCLITLKRPRKIRGGILADESGTGKTLTLLSLIAYTKQNNAAACRHVRKKHKGAETEWRPTLVVCPPSVLATWKGQIEQYTWPGSLKVCIYQGKGKTRDPDLLRRHDLVLTTYNIVVKEEVSGPRILSQIDWLRVVLDDVHLLTSTKSRANIPFTNLKAERRWALTGKPVHLDYENYNFYPIMAFLQIHPFCNGVDWEFLVNFDLRGTQGSRLKILMDMFALRRTMPVRFIENYLVLFSREEQDLYDSMELEAQKAVEFGLRSSQAAVLQLWQSCNNLALCCLSGAEMVLSANFRDLNHEPELLERWVAVLQEEKDYACPVCMDQPDDIVITRCAHLFCGSCIIRMFNKCKGNKKSSCPLCRSPLSKCDIFAAQRGSSVLEKMKSVTEVGSSSANISSKVSALLSLLLKSKAEDPKRKSVVFSQFRRMLMLVEGVLSNANFDVRRLDVSDNANTKVKTVEEFANVDRPVVLLCSFKALSNTTGLDLSAASNVYMMEPCWNAHNEEEALGRVHRLGKKDDISVVRLVCKNSIEERVLEMRKQTVAYGSSNSKREVNISNREDIKKLLGL